MSDSILFICEGQRTEPMILENMKSNNLLPQKIIYIGVHCGEIYSLYHKIQNDPDLDIVRLILEDPRNSTNLGGIDPEKISEIYLLFDYDGHAPAASDEKIQTMLRLFNEETDKGKLFISYPMVEAIKHIPTDGGYHTLTIELTCQYKAQVAQDCDKSYLNISQYTSTHWKEIIRQNIKKMRWICEDVFELPRSHIEQEDIHINQIKKFVCQGKVAVLSAFPAFILSYYGIEKTVSLIE